MNIYDLDAQNKKKYEKVPDVITIRLDEEQERRFNVLVASLGCGTKVQLLRNLLSGDEGTITTICTKAKSIPLAPKEVVVSETPIRETRAVVESKDAIEELVRRKVSEFEKELRVILAEQRGMPSVRVMPKQEKVPITESSNASEQQFEHGDVQASDKPKRARRKKASSGIDHLKERQQIIDYFNFKCGRNLSSESKESIKAIDRMLDAGN
jgi:hypothetical protein